jgi:regulator of nucleoside diphosphate kinase
MKQRTIFITSCDMRRLRRLLESALNLLRHDRPYLDALKQELEAAQVVKSEDIPRDLVALNSQIHIRDLDTGKQMACSVVFPKDSNGGDDRLSVLAPIGAAVLGRRIGDIFECRVPAGVRRFKLEGIETEASAPLPVAKAAWVIVSAGPELQFKAPPKSPFSNGEVS